LIFTQISFGFSQLSFRLRQFVFSSAIQAISGSAPRAATALFKRFHLSGSFALYTLYGKPPRFKTINSSLAVITSAKLRISYLLTQQSIT
jgi:hypothetical protein